MLPWFSKYIAALVLALIAIVIGIFLSLESNLEPVEAVSPVPTEKFSATPCVAETAPAALPQEAAVYVVGAVLSPGIYNVPVGSLVSVAIDAAGGFSSDADPAGINLVDVIEGNVMIKVPARGEAGGVTAAGSAGSSSGDGPSFTEGSGGKVNLNTADLTALCSVPGVGESTASKIIKYRESNGRFNSIEDVMNISGIKQAKFESMRDYICVE